MSKRFLTAYEGIAHCSDRGLPRNIHHRLASPICEARRPYHHNYMAGEAIRFATKMTKGDRIRSAFLETGNVTRRMMAKDPAKIHSLQEADAKSQFQDSKKSNRGQVPAPEESDGNKLKKLQTIQQDIRTLINWTKEDMRDTLPMAAEKHQDNQERSRHT